MSKDKVNKKWTFADLFAGIGGFHLAFHKLGAKCVFASEWDKEVRKTYEAYFKKREPDLFASGNFIGDIYEIKNPKKEIPDFDILCAGFPCQAFSQAGYKKGFGDSRGTLFFEIVKILKAKKPAAYFLENVSHLFRHDGGRTFEIIKRILEEELDYSFKPKIIRASDFGLPQHRPRLFMVGFKDKNIPFDFPNPRKLKMTMSDVFEGKCNRPIGYTLRVGGRKSSIDDRRNWDTYIVNGEKRILGPEEGKKMMGFPKSFRFSVSETRAMKQLGNSVAVPAVLATAKQIIKSLNLYYDKRK